MSAIEHVLSFAAVKYCLPLFLMLLHCVSIAADVPPLSLKPDYPIVDSCAYANDAAARDTWKPMDTTTPVSLTRLAAGRQVLKLPCNFNGTKIARASWDRTID